MKHLCMKMHARLQLFVLASNYNSLCISVIPSYYTSVLTHTSYSCMCHKPTATSYALIWLATAVYVEYGQTG